MANMKRVLDQIVEMLQEGYEDEDISKKLKVPMEWIDDAREMVEQEYEEDMASL
jgi:uncharacterized protein (DUF433 family)